MFIFNLTYIQPIEKVESFLPEHIRYWEEHYQTNQFICSGRKVPRTGGIILCNCVSREEAEKIVQEDPFYREKIAQYDIVEFIPSKASAIFKKIVDVGE